VTNDYGIVGGRDQEDDESYRYRVHLKLISQAGSNEASMRFALLQVPGMQDVVFDRRAGTFTCYVYAITPVAAASVLRMVQDSIDQTVAFPLPRCISAISCTMRSPHK
jgi:Baseplate J-like protein